MSTQDTVAWNLGVWIITTTADIMGPNNLHHFIIRGQQKTVHKAVWNLQYITQAKIQYL
jgi:hypothetical protein